MERHERRVLIKGLVSDFVVALILGGLVLLPISLLATGDSRVPLIIFAIIGMILSFFVGVLMRRHRNKRNRLEATRFPPGDVSR